MAGFVEKEIKISIMEGPVLAIDLGTSFLKSILFSIEREKLNFFDFLKTPYDPKSRKDFKLKLKELILKENLNFNSVIIGVGEGVGKGKIKEKNFLRKRPGRPIKSGEFERMIKSIQEESFFEAKEEFKNQEIFQVSARVKKVMIDGKETSSPIGACGERVFLKIINLYLPEDFYKEIKNIFLSLKIKSFSFEYIPEILNNFPLQYVLRKNSSLKYIGSKFKIFIDVGGENTQISFSREGELLKVKEIPFGGNHFIKKIIKTLKIKKEDLSLEEGEDIIRFKIRKETPLPKIEKEIKEILYSELREWEQKIIPTMGYFKKENFPKEIYLFGGGSGLLLFNKLKRDFSKLLFPCIIKRVKPLDLKDINFRSEDFQATIPFLICKTALH